MPIDNTPIKKISQYKKRKLRREQLEIDINGIHAKRMHAIRPYVNFDYDLKAPLSKSRKQRIKAYFDEIEALTQRPFSIYRPRNKKRLKKAQEFAQHEKQLPGLKAAFIPTDGVSKPKIRFDKQGNLIARTNHITTRFLVFNKSELIKNPKAHTESVINRDKSAKRFTILAGRFEIPISYDRALISKYVAYYAERYSIKTANNYFGNWMIGVNAHTFHDQADYEEYAAARANSRKALKKKRKNKKRQSKKR